MSTQLVGRAGFGTEVSGHKAIFRRARTLEALATAALALALVVAMTAVSIGIARADTARMFATGDGASLALALFLGLLLAGMGGLTALATRRRAPRD
jgi:hypothetical protein